MTWVLQTMGVDGKRAISTDPLLQEPSYLLAWDPDYQPTQLDDTSGKPMPKGLVSRTHDIDEAKKFDTKADANQYAARVSGHIFDPIQV